jgi:hypothetical protein
MTISPAMLAQLMPLATAWAREGEAFILKNGAALGLDQAAAALLAGVQSPKMIRVLIVPKIPIPPPGPLAQANQAVGLVTGMTVGLTLNYGIFIRADCARDNSLLIHECVHVSQYERLGGFDGFIPKYLAECIQFGYPNSPLEREAVEVTKKLTNAL